MLQGNVAVIGSGRQVVWIMAACAALAAQATPTAICLACDLPCCAAGTIDSAPRSVGDRFAPASGCTSCAAPVDLPPAESDGPPCNCQLDARQDQPLALSRSTLQQGTDDAAVNGPVASPAFVPQTLGISREYEAASLAMPIRPARILFGVWRN